MLLSKYFDSDHIKGNELGGHAVGRMGSRNTYRLLVEKSEGTILL
jgi:hypothetical protein